MKRRVIIFSKLKNEPHDLIFFSVAGESLILDLKEVTLTQFAQANKLRHHDTFDWAAGDAGATCTLMESQPIVPTEEFCLQGSSEKRQWLSFPQAVRKLKDGTDKRLLQLAVQYLSAGGVDNESVLATEYNDAIVHEMISQLDEKSNKH